MRLVFTNLAYRYARGYINFWEQSEQIAYHTLLGVSWSGDQRWQPPQRLIVEKS
jgi:hypothetical protein